MAKQTNTPEKKLPEFNPLNSADCDDATKITNNYLGGNFIKDEMNFEEEPDDEKKLHV